MKLINLVPELKKSIVPGPLGPMIAHPLVHDIIYTEQLNHQFNERLKYKKLSIKAALKKRDYTSFVFLHERPYRMDALLKVSKICGGTDVFWRLARDVWEDSENIWQYLREWEELFSSNCPHSEHFMSDEERNFFSSLPEKFEIHRGYKHGVNEYGLSWTLSKEKAEWFSNRFQSRKETSAVKSRMVSKAECFAYISGRNEEEIIIKPLWVLS